MVFAILVLLGRYINYTLDLAGIAGLIIGIGMTADSFVVFFERIKDEIREGRSFRSAVPRGWARARKTIISGNAVTFLAAVVLYVLAVGQVKGFAFTLGLTTILDVVVVFLVTWPLVYLASKSTCWPNRRSTASAPCSRSRASAGPPRIDGTGIVDGQARSTLTSTESGAVEAAGPGAAADSGAPQHGFFVRLYTGTGAFEVIGRRKLWYTISGRDRRDLHREHRVRGFTFGIDFEGGTKVSMPAARRRHARPAGRGGVQPDAGQGHRIGRGRRQRRFGDGADPVGDAEQRRDRTSCATRCSTRSSPRAPTASPASRPSAIRRCRRPGAGRSPRRRCWRWWCSWCSAAIYIAMRYERYMAIAAMATLVFDLVVTAGVYSLVGFEVTPGHRDRPADHPGLLAVRHRHRVRQGRGEHPRLPAHHPADLRRAGQPGHQPDLHAVDQHQPHLGAADHRP